MCRNHGERAIGVDFNLEKTTRIWGWPVFLGLLTASGLITALVSESWGDAWSWLALGLPLAVAAWCIWLRPAARPSSSTQ